MSRVWGPRSQKVHGELCKELQEATDYILHNVADISLTTGHRGKEEQDSAYPRYTKVRWPDGKHNKLPSDAVDFQPHPLPTNPNKLWASLAYVAGHIIAYGKSRGIQFRWGGDWDSDGDLTDQNFDDLFHIEVVRK